MAIASPQNLPVPPPPTQPQRQHLRAASTVLSPLGTLGSTALLVRCPDLMEALTSVVAGPKADARRRLGRLALVCRLWRDVAVHAFCAGGPSCASSCWMPEVC